MWLFEKKAGFAKCSSFNNLYSVRVEVSEIAVYCKSLLGLQSPTLKGAHSLHAPFSDLVRMIKYRVSIGQWSIYYCHVVLIGCPRLIFTWHCHGLPQICGSQVWHNESKSDISVAMCLVPLVGSVFSGLYRYILN